MRYKANKVRASRKRRIRNLEMPRWRTVLAAFVLLIGLMLLLAAIAEPSGYLRPIGLRGGVYMVAILTCAFLLGYLDLRHKKKRNR